MVCFFAHPITEGRAEPVRRVWLSHHLEQFAHRHIRHRLFATDAGKDNGAAGKAKFRAPLDDADSARAEWHHMLPVAFIRPLGMVHRPSARSISSQVAQRTSPDRAARSEEHTSALQSLMRIAYAAFRL